MSVPSEKMGKLLNNLKSLPVGRGSLVQVMVAKGLFDFPSILNRSKTSNYVNSITCDGVLSLASNFSSCCFRRLVSRQLNPYLDSLYDSHIVGRGSYANF